MYQRPIVALDPPLESHAEILECLSVRIETLVPRPLYADHLRREIQHLPQFRLLLADLVLRALAFRDVDDRADNLVVARFVPHAMRAIVEMLYRAIRHQQPMLVVEVTFASGRTRNRVFDEADIVWMRSPQDQLGR